MIPLRDDNPTRTVPFVTLTIIALNCIVFLQELAAGPELEGLISRFAVIPYYLLHRYLASDLLTVITSLFLHSGLAHLGGNMLFLWIFGNNIEDKLGHIKFLLFYLLCGIAATYAFALTHSESTQPLIGASGAISGVLGAYIVLYPKAKVLVLLPLFFFWRVVRMNAFWFIGAWVVFQLFYAVTGSAVSSTASSIAFLAHLAGFVAGIGLLLFLL